MSAFRIAAIGCLLLLVDAAAANRNLLQTSLSNLPSFTGVPLTVTNAADSSATQTTQGTLHSPPPPPAVQATVTDPATGAQVPVPSTLVLPKAAVAPTPANVLPALTPENKVTQTPALAPAVKLPVIETPAPAPATHLPVIDPPRTPAPAPSTQLPVTDTPTPAPSTQLLVVTVPAPQPAAASPPPPILSVPTPAPLVLPIVTAPVPAPQVVAPAAVPMVPAPAPQLPPLCGIEPQCRLFVEDLLCCDSAGALTNKQHAVLRLQCTHPVNYFPKCFNVTGPSNMTAFNQFDTDIWSTSHTAQVNFLDDFMGNVSVDLEGPRTNANLSADCGLYISPCMFNGSLVTQVAPVLGLSFTTLPTDDFLEVSSSLDEDVSNLDSLVMPNLYYPQACQQQNVGDLGADFFAADWVSYASGFQSTCNYTAFVDAMAPAPSTNGPLDQYASGSVMTASLG